MDVYAELEKNGFALLPEAVGASCLERLQAILDVQIRTDSVGSLAQSNSGQVYAARNLL
jgi:hypothetical protein